MQSVGGKFTIARLMLQLAMLASAAGSLFFWFFYFTLYWPYRGLFNADGRYFDETDLVVHHEQTGLFIVPAAAFLLLTAILGCILWRTRSASANAAVR